MSFGSCVCHFGMLCDMYMQMGSPASPAPFREGFALPHVAMAEYGSLASMGAGRMEEAEDVWQGRMRGEKAACQAAFEWAVATTCAHLRALASARRSEGREDHTMRPEKCLFSTWMTRVETPSVTDVHMEFLEGSVTRGGRFSVTSHGADTLI